VRDVGLAIALTLLGYGLTIVLGLIAHESRAIGLASLLLGAALLGWWAFTRRAVTERPATEVPSLFRWGLAGLGATACVGTLAYNAARQSSLSPAEMALVAYGLLVLASLPWLAQPLGRRLGVATLVAWSLPVVLAPLVIYALNGLLTSQAGASHAAASPAVRWLLVEPTALLLRALGHEVGVLGNALVLGTPRGSLALSVGLVCAGIYPVVLFAGLFALHAWDRRPPLRQAALQAAAGLAVLWLLNLLRMVILAKVGVRFGIEALQQVHDQIGWILFSAFSGVYWWAVLRRTSPRLPPKAVSPT
jgi:exosortase/archaeosortase family protein